MVSSVIPKRGSVFAFPVEDRVVHLQGDACCGVVKKFNSCKNMQTFLKTQAAMHSLDA